MTMKTTAHQFLSTLINKNPEPLASKFRKLDLWIDHPSFLDTDDKEIAKQLGLKPNIIHKIKCSLLQKDSEDLSYRFYVTKHGTVSLMDVSKIRFNNKRGRA